MDKAEERQYLEYIEESLRIRVSVREMKKSNNDYIRLAGKYIDEEMAIRRSEFCNSTQLMTYDHGVPSDFG